MPSLHAEFIKSAVGIGDSPADDAAEVAFAGRSNAGKSSVLNAVSGHRRLARVSRTPGRTQQINFFAVAGGGRLVDLPGYGYAAAARDARDRWQRGVNEYLSGRRSLRGLVLVMDIRHPLKDTDRLALDAAAMLRLPALALLNKADKINASERQRTLAQVTRELPPDIRALVFSTRDGTGLPALTAQVAAWLADRLPDRGTRDEEERGPADFRVAPGHR